MTQKLIPNLWFDTEAEEAANFYCSVFEGGRILRVTRYPASGPREEGMVMTVEFEVAGMRLVAINGGSQFTFDEAVSLQVSCADQAEVDRYWAALTAGGGSEGPCGWCKDRYGFSWQVVPEGMDELFADPDRAAADRAMRAMQGMGKLDIAALRAAAAGA